MRDRRSLAATVMASLLLGATMAGGFAGVASAASPRGSVAGTKPAWANPGNYVRTADRDATVGFRLYLRWRDQAGAEAVARAVSDPKSASYGKFLSPAEFRQRFAPRAGEVARVQQWLRSQRFEIRHTPTNNHYVAAEGSVSDIEAAFGTHLGMYRAGGRIVRSPASDISLPSSIAPLIRGVAGLDESYEFVHTNTAVDKQAPPAGGFRNAPPCSRYWAQTFSPYAFPAGYRDLALPSVPWAPCGYTPAQIKGAYGIGGGLDGAGQTVAIIDAYASPTILQDVNAWSAARGLPRMTSAQLVQVVAPGTYRRPANPQHDPQGWYGEETLDVEAVHGMAPAAKIVYVGAPNNRRDLDAAMNHVVDRKLAQIVTNSYGFATELLPKGYIKPYEDTLIQAAAEGIGVYFSSGDSGDESSRFGFATTEWPTSSPWVTAVGGTSLGVGAANDRVLETGWGTSTYACSVTTVTCARQRWLYGAGGGVSRVFGKPAYQSALSVSGRAVPDVAALADPQTGMMVGQTQTFPDGTYYSEYRIGGTSLASPIFAGIMALADQAAGHAHGFANPLFYAHPGAFYDVRSVKTAVARRNYNNGVDPSAGTADFLRTFDDYSGSPSQHTGPGWDNVTGLGTPNGSFLTTFGR